MNLETATRLQQLRKKHGLSQEELADKLGVSRQAVSKWERAESSPDTDNLICLAKLYGVSLDELLDIPVEPTDVDLLKAESIADQENVDEDTPKSNIANVLQTIIPLVCTAIYFILGGVWNLWHPGWIIFVAIPVFESLIIAIQRKKMMDFAFPVLCVVVYLCLGCIWGWWQWGWIVFFAVPMFYSVAGIVDGKFKLGNKK